ncbi:MAG: hypothetical protein ABSD50_16390 [Smithella sp.]|jgi:hypothetical protein
MKRRLISQTILCAFVMMLLLISGCSNSSSSNPLPTTTTYSISGAVNGTVAANVAITLSGTSAANTTTASDGTYSFSGLANGSYIVTPSLTGYSFSPSSTGVKINGADGTADFTSSTASGLNFTVAGVVSGAVASDVDITLTGANSGGTTITASNGTYSLAFANGDTIVITPSLAGYWFMPANIVNVDATSNINGANFASGNAGFSQSDLQGTWYFHMLWTDGSNSDTGSKNGWLYGTANIDAGGNLTISCTTSNSNLACPTGVQWTVAANGDITETVGSNVTPSHYSMASNKTFIAGAQGNPGMLIAQKEVSGTTYSESDIESTSFVLHKLRVGYQNDNNWEYDTGTIASNATLTTTEQCGSNIESAVIGSPICQTTGLTSPGTLTVNSDGTVTISTDTTWHGFLSSDKKTIVSTSTHQGTAFDLYVVQITTGQSDTAGPLPAGIYTAELLAGYTTPVGEGSRSPFAANWTNTSISGTLAYYYYSDTLGNSAPPARETATISSSGGVTLSGGTNTFGGVGADSQYNGQMSYDGYFIVGTLTQTDTEGDVWASLVVHTR